jgi:histone H3/H4
MASAAGKRSREFFEALLELKVPDDFFPVSWTEKKKVEIFKKAKNSLDVNGDRTLIELMETLISDEETTAEFEQEEAEWQGDEEEEQTCQTVQVRMEWEDAYTEVYKLPIGGVTMDKTLVHIKNAQHFSTFLNDVPFERMQLWSDPRNTSNSKMVAIPKNIRTGMKLVVKVAEEGSSQTLQPSSGKKVYGKAGGSSRQSTLDEFAQNNGNGGSSHEVISLVGDTEVVEIMDSEEEVCISVYLDSEPSKKAKVSFLPSLMGLPVFKERCFDALNLNTVEDCDVHFVSKGGGFELLRRPKDLYPDAEVILSRLQHYAFVDHKVPLIGKKQFTRTVEDYPDNLSKRRIQTVFSHYRKVGGDGNCFYRAVYLNLVEQLSFGIVAAFDNTDAVEEVRATSLFHAFFQRLYEAKRIRDCPADVAMLKEINAELMEFCSKCREDDEKENKPGNVLKQRLAAEPLLDEVLVRAARCVAAQYLEEATDAERAEAEAIFRRYEPQMSLEAFVAEVVLEPSRSSPGRDVVIFFASRIFKARICIWRLDPDSTERLSCCLGGEGGSLASDREGGGAGEGDFFGVVHLLLREVYYDLLYLSGKAHKTSMKVFASGVAQQQQALEEVKAICARLRLPIDEAEAELKTCCCDAGRRRNSQEQEDEGREAVTGAETEEAATGPDSSFSSASSSPAPPPPPAASAPSPFINSSLLLRDRAGLLFIPSVVAHLASSFTACPLSLQAAVALTAALEYMSAEVLELAGIAANDLKLPEISPRCMVLAIGGDEELNQFFCHSAIRQGGVISHFLPEQDYDHGSGMGPLPRKTDLMLIKKARQSETNFGVDPRTGLHFRLARGGKEDDEDEDEDEEDEEDDEELLQNYKLLPCRLLDEFSREISSERRRLAMAALTETEREIVRSEGFRYVSPDDLPDEKWAPQSLQAARHNRLKAIRAEQARTDFSLSCPRFLSVVRHQMNEVAMGGPCDEMITAEAVEALQTLCEAAVLKVLVSALKLCSEKKQTYLTAVEIQAVKTYTFSAGGCTFSRQGHWFM